MSKAETEYIALAMASQHLHAIRLMFIQAVATAAISCGLSSDNMAVVAMMAKSHGTKRRKCFDLRYQMLQHMVADGSITISHVITHLQKADMLTKVLHRVIFERQCQALQMVLTPPTGGTVTSE